MTLSVRQTGIAQRKTPLHLKFPEPEMSGKQESNTAEQNSASRSVSQSVMSLERGQSVMTVCFMGHADE